MSTTNKIALVTGGTGFIGKHLMQRLTSDGWKVHCLTRNLSDIICLNNVTYHQFTGDYSQLNEIIKISHPDIVFHLAAFYKAEHSALDILPMIEANITFGTLLLNSMAENNVQNLIFASTSWQHFKNEEYNPVCLYAATKKAFIDISKFFIEANNLKMITLKLFDTYGPGDSRKKLFYLLTEAARNNQILNMSTGEQLIDLVYIDDAIDAFVMSADRLLSNTQNTYEEFVVSSGRAIPLKNLVNTILKSGELSVHINWGKLACRKREVMQPFTNGVLVPGWRSRTNLAKGLKQIFKEKKDGEINE